MEIMGYFSLEYFPVQEAWHLDKHFSEEAHPTIAMEESGISSCQW